MKIYTVTLLNAECGKIIKFVLIQTVFTVNRGLTIICANGPNKWLEHGYDI